MTSSLQNNGYTPLAPIGIDKIPDAQTALNVTAATIIKDSPGRLASVSVIVAGSAAGAAYDAVSTSGNTAADQVAVIPNTVGVYDVDWPCLAGIIIAPGAGQTVAVAYY